MTIFYQPIKLNNMRELVQELTRKFGTGKENLLPVLQVIAEKHRCVSNEAIIEVAEAMNLSTAEVFGTTTFYSFLDTKPRGKYIIRVCKTIVCDMHGKKQILKTLEDILRIKCGETTHNRMFSILETNCLGWCHEGPAMLINDDVYSELTPEKVREIIGELQNK